MDTFPGSPGNNGNDKKQKVVYVVFQSLGLPPRLESALEFLDTFQDTNTGSDTAFQLVFVWNDECHSTHARCRASSSDDPLLPHRVIDVGSLDNSAEPYLLETSDQTGKYLTLSHCWGGASSIKTTTENIQQYYTEIRLQDLPRTFRDAVYVTRKLGYRYLWIDSLCIIQNNKKDWEVEAAMMHQYYKQSLLTISAADGGNSEAGLFRDREAVRNQPCEIQITDAQGYPQKMLAYTNSMSFELNRSSLSESFKLFLLYSRAWVFQEQALSPRTLIYARDRISWRCQKCLFDERAPLVKKIEDFIKEDKRTDIMTRRGDPRRTDAAIAELQQKWIFPISDLSETHRRRPELERLDIAPSWSWASISGEVIWPGHWLCRVEPKVDIIQLKHYESAVKASAALTVETNVRLALKEDRQFFLINRQEDSGEQASMEPGNISQDSRWPIDNLKTPVFLDENIGNYTMIWFIELAAKELHVQGHRKDIHCLILAQCNNDNSTYRRVGYSLWEQSKWANAKLPMLQKMKLKII
ncbi:hypothetical protein B7463_g2592, partial [Scytalidium lignicola]